MSNYGCGLFILDCILVLITGGLWLIWIFVREMRRRKQPLARSYARKDCKEIPIDSMISIVNALIYFVSLIDLLPDGIPVLGYDAAVFALVWIMVEDDVEEYKKLQMNNGKRIIED